MTSFTTPKVDFSKSLDLSVCKDISALITGGASGMGLAMTESLAAAGAFVTIADVNKDGEAIAQGLRDKGYNVIFAFTDTTSYDSQLSAFKACLAKSPNGTVDLVVANAGISGTSILDDAAAPTLEGSADPKPPPTLCMNINITGVYYTAYLALHYFHKTAPNTSGNKQIIFVSSIAGYGELPRGAQYATSKFGVRGMWKAIRHVCGDYAGVRANLIAPSFVYTPMAARMKAALEGHGIKMAEVADFVDAAMRLVCDKTISARAIAIAPTRNDTDAPGSANFDLCDDLEDHDAGMVMKKEMTKQGNLQFTADELADTGVGAKYSPVK